MRRSSCVDLPFGFRWSVVADMRYFQLSQKATAMQHSFELLETKAILRPMPLLQPVTTATCPLRSSGLLSKASLIFAADWNYEKQRSALLGGWVTCGIRLEP